MNFLTRFIYALIIIITLRIVMNGIRIFLIVLSKIKTLSRQNIVIVLNKIVNQNNNLNKVHAGDFGII